jgi:hypothetical protein
VLTVDFIVPEQLSPQAAERPEVVLWAAVLSQAIGEYRRGEDCPHRFRTRRIGREAQEWILSELIEVGSFVWICQTVGLDADYARTEIFRAGASRGVLRRNARRTAIRGVSDASSRPASSPRQRGDERTRRVAAK